MGLEAIWDNVAAHAATVAGIKGVYASGAGGAGSVVRVIPDDFSDWPVVEVIYEGSEIDVAMGNEDVTHTFSLRIWMSRSDIGTAVKTLAPMFERFVIAYRSKFTLLGANGGARITGASGFLEEDRNEKPYLYQDLVLTAVEHRNTTYT